MTRHLPLLTLCCALSLLGCTDDDPAPVEVTDTGTATANDVVETDDTSGADTSVDDAGQLADIDEDTGGEEDVATAEDTSTTEDTDGSDGPDTDSRPRMVPVVDKPSAPTDDGSCQVIGATKCEGETAMECVLVSTETGEPATEVSPMAQQAYQFDRYLDLYHTFNGQTVDLKFKQPVPPGTPEAEWTNPEVLKEMDAFGDASGWTGTSLIAAAARYRATETAADYERMVRMFEEMMMFYTVTGIDGMMARSHFGMLPEGAEVPTGPWGRALARNYPDDGASWHYHYPIPEDVVPLMPDYYTSGVESENGTLATEARWQGDASRDMYVRSLPGIMLAYDLLHDGEREDTLRAQVKRQMTCTLNRLKRMEIINLQQAPDILESVTAYLQGANMVLDEDDLDFGTLETIVVYVMEQPNPAHWDLFDPTCPDSPPFETDPELTLDAASPTFLLDLLEFGIRLTRDHERPIVWPMAVSVRAGDLIHMTQWAMTAWYVTGEDKYLDFLEQLMTEVPYDGVLLTYGAFQLPRWCTPHFAPSLTYPSLWNLLARIDKDEYPEMWTVLSRVAVEEGREKEMAGRDDAYWGLMYNRMADSSTDPTKSEYVQAHIEVLEGYGMDPTNKLEPDRNYSRNWVDNPVDGVELEEPSEEVIAICESPISIEIYGAPIDLEAPGMSDMNPRAKNALPLHLRIGGGFNWTQDPWIVKREFGTGEYTKQYPMVGMTAPYWLGRMDGLITAGESVRLEWREAGTTCD